MSKNDIVQKLWNLCNVLRDDGINYSDYVTELVQILFIKMVDEQAQVEKDFKHTLPEGCRWDDLKSKSGIELLNRYKLILFILSTGKGQLPKLDNNGHEVYEVYEEDGEEKQRLVMVDVEVTDKLILAIYADAQTSLREPKHLSTLVKAIDDIKDWFSAKEDGLGDLYEGLLEKNANETKSGAGQYFTPRPLIDSIIRCIKPLPKEVIQDPAAGTAGFLTAAHDHIKNLQKGGFYDLKVDIQENQVRNCYIGMELVPNTRRLALMNCLLHGMEGGEEGVVLLGNTLSNEGAGKLPKAKVILTNPPFGTSKGGGISKEFVHKTSNKQLAFLQHIYGSLKPGGRAAVVLPDNVLFEAGVGTEIRKELMNQCNLHTILRLPTGIFYAQGVKTNVLFFTKGTAENKNQKEKCTKNVWVYDLRSNMPNFGKRTPFGSTHLDPFEKVFGDKSDGTSKRKEGEWSFTEGEQMEENSRWRCFSREWIAESKGDSLDISWIKDDDSVDAADLPDPELLAGEAMGELTEALRELNDLMIALGADDEAQEQRDLLVESLGLGVE